MANEIEAYIRQAAAARGIDPDIAVRVARSEGGLNDPFRRGEGPAPRSQAAGMGDTESSFGPMQLYISGNNAGLGDRALAAGIDPRTNWKGGIDFGLDEAARVGWGQWFGAKAAGIGNMQGIGGGVAPKGVSLASNPVSGNSLGQAPAPPITASRTIDDAPIAEVAAADVPSTFDIAKKEGIVAAAKELFGNDKKVGALAGIFKDANSGQDAQAQAHAEPIQSSLPSMEAGDAARMQAASTLMAQLMGQRRQRGLSLMG